MFIAFFVQFGYAFHDCKNQKFLSLDSQAGICQSVIVDINGKYYLDDNGFWSTKSEWAFASTMVSATFREYRHSLKDWNGKRNNYKNGISEKLWTSLHEKNKELSNKGTAQTLVSLVAAADFPIRGDGAASYELRVDVEASPISLMKSQFSDVSAGRIVETLTYGKSEAGDDGWRFDYNSISQNNGNLQRYVKFTQDIQYADDGGAVFSLRLAKSSWKSLFPSWKEADGKTDDQYWGEFPTPNPSPKEKRPTPGPTSKPTSKPTLRPTVRQPTARPTNSRPVPTPKPTHDNIFRIQDKTPTPTTAAWDERFVHEAMELKINKYSLWTAAAVNMGIISFDELM